MKPAWTVTIADDHPLVLRGLEGLIATSALFDVVGTASDGDSALALIRKKRPDLAILDVHMPRRTGLDVLRGLQNSTTGTRFILLTATLADEDLLDAIALGADGIVLKDVAPESLLDCLQQVARGGRWLAPNLLQRSLERSSASWLSPGNKLTAREFEIVTLVTEGISNKAIGLRLGVSEGTVKTHLHNIFEKLAVPNRTALTALSLNRLR